MKRAAAVLALALTAHVALVAIRLAAPDDLLTRDQQRVAAYVLDATERGHWLFQEDFHGNVSSKPPLFNWIAAAASELVGTTDRLALATPSWLASAICLLLIVWVTGRVFGLGAAGFAALGYLFSQLGLRQVLLVRTDTVFQCAVFATSLLAYRAWTGQGRWTPCWIAAAAATLTKGPLALLLVLFGFAAVQHERRSGQSLPAARSNRLLASLPGVCAFLLLTGGWFLAANYAMDGRVWDKLIVDELVGHAVGTKDDFGYPGERFTRPWAWFATRLLPISGFAAVAMVRCLRRPSKDAAQRRLQRFLCWQVLLGLLLFALASENRFVHLLPLMPATAVLGGAECARMLRARWPKASSLRVQTVVAGIAVVGSAAYLIGYDRSTFDIERGGELAAFAREVRARVEDRSGAAGRELVPLRHRVPDALYAHLGAWPDPELEEVEIVARLQGAAPCCVATTAPEVLRGLLPDGAAVHVLVAGRYGAEDLQLLGNVETLPAGLAVGQRSVAGTLLLLAACGALVALLGRRVLADLRDVAA